MKQLLIVKSGTSLLSSGTLDNLAEGQLAIVNAKTGALITSGAAAVDFALALGRPNGQMPFMIPEVNLASLHVNSTIPAIGAKMKRKFTVPASTTNIGVMFVKKGTVPHERNTWTVLIPASGTAATDATALAAAINNSGVKDLFTTTVSTADITIVAKEEGPDWDIKLIEDLKNVSFAGSTDYVEGKSSVGTTENIKQLASMCAAGKGFVHTEGEGKDYLPGYPEAVERTYIDKAVSASSMPGSPSKGDVVKFTGSTAGGYTQGHYYLYDGSAWKDVVGGYIVYTLRFAVPRASAKTRDEVVNQLVHIAVPNSSAIVSTLNTFLSTSQS